MSLAIHSASGTPGELDLLLIQINHPAWATPLRYAVDTRDWTVTLEDSTTVLFPKMGGTSEGPPTDDTGVDLRNVQVADPDNVLMKRLEQLVGDVREVEVKLYQYLTTDLTQPETYGVFAMANPSRADRVVSFEASTLNTINRDAPTEKFTYDNSPGLRR